MEESDLSEDTFHLMTKHVGDKKEATETLMGHEFHLENQISENDEPGSQIKQLPEVCPRLQEAWNRFHEFEEFDMSSLTLAEFVPQWIERMGRALRAGCQYSGPVLAFKLLKKINIHDEAVFRILSNCDFDPSHCKEPFLEQVINVMADLSLLPPNVLASQTGTDLLEELSFDNDVIVSLDDDPLNGDDSLEESIEVKYDWKDTSHEEEVKLSSDDLVIEDEGGHFKDVVINDSEFFPEKDEGVPRKNEIRSGGKGFCCQICGKHFRNQAHLNGHMLKHFDIRDFLCNVCQKRFKTKRHLKVHMQTHSKEKPMKCPTCPKQFSSGPELERHLNKHNNVKPFACLDCGLSYYGKQDLRTHVQAKHREKKFQCEFCNKLFATNSELKSHRKVHTGEKTEQCEICERMFATKAKLTDHMRVHTGVMPFSCPMCSKKFRHKCQLNVHIKMHTGNREYKCDLCDKAFYKSNDLVRHSIVHTGERPFQCESCPKNFTRLDHLKTHTMSHTGEKPFQCTQCPKSFIKNSILTRHMRVHTGDKPFQCAICQKRFAQSGDLRKHQRSHEGKRAPKQKIKYTKMISHPENDLVPAVQPTIDLEYTVEPVLEETSISVVVGLDTL